MVSGGYGIAMLGWIVLALLQLIAPILLLIAAVLIARRTSMGIGAALILGGAVTLLNSLVSAFLFSPWTLQWLGLGAQHIGYISMVTRAIGLLGSLSFAGGFLALALWLPQREQ